MKNGRSVRNIAIMVAAGSGLFLWAADPPAGLLRKIAQREAENASARGNYTYRQVVIVEELNPNGMVTGTYREARDITFTPNMERFEQVVEEPRNSLKHLKLTDEDFADLRNVQPFLLTNEQVPLYEGKFQGEEVMDGQPCFVERIRPRQILSTQRFFEGLLWVRQTDLAVIRSEGQAVPQIETLKEQNLFPHFTTIRKVIDGKWLFPVETYADDTLFFRGGPQRIRVQVKYSDYKRFGADSVIKFDQK